VFHRIHLGIKIAFILPSIKVTIRLWFCICFIFSGDHTSSNEDEKLSFHLLDSRILISALYLIGEPSSRELAELIYRNYFFFISEDTSHSSTSTLCRTCLRLLSSLILRLFPNCRRVSSTFKSHQGYATLTALIREFASMIHLTSGGREEWRERGILNYI
jgi:hypothetical protein